MTFSTRIAPWVLSIVVLANAPAGAQQPNTPTATLRINGATLPYGPLSTTVTNCTGFNLLIDSGPNPSIPFTLVMGPLSTGYSGIQGVGIVDLDFSQPSFAFLMDGIFGGAFGGNPTLNLLARTDPSGLFTLTAAVSLGTPSGTLGAFQALMTDPLQPSGFNFTAATNVSVLGGASGGFANPPTNSAVTVAFSQGFIFRYYGTTYTSVNIAENGLLGFGSLATLQAAASIQPGFTQPVTNATGFLGTAGTPVPPIIGFFEDLAIAANGGAGSILYSQTPTQFNITWCGCRVTQGSSLSEFTISLYGDASASPGRIEITVSSASTIAGGNGRVLGISPGGNGTTSTSPTLAATNLSAISRNILATGQNVGFLAGTANSAIFESFNRLWGNESPNAVFDLLGVTLRFTPSFPSTGLGPYNLRALSEAPVSVVGVSPNSSPLTGGGQATIRGTGFRNDGTTSAAFGTLGVGPPVYIDSETLLVTIPVSPVPQTVNVNVIIGSSSQSASLLNAFAYSIGPLNGTLPLIDEELVTYNFNPGIFASFNYFGVAYTRVFVQANGQLFFGAQPPVLPQPLSFTSSPATWNGYTHGVIAPLFNDLCADPIVCAPALASSNVQTIETTASFTVRWNGWTQWPNQSPGLIFSVTLDKTFNPASRITFDYSQSLSSPSPLYSQPTGTSGIIVGIRGPGTFIPTFAPSNLLTLAGPVLGTPGAIVNSGNTYHWIRSFGYTGPVLGSTVTWPFGNVFNTSIGSRIEFLATNASNNAFQITLF